MSQTEQDGPSASRYVGIDVGATKTAIALGLPDGRLLSQQVVPTVLREPETLADTVAAAVLELHGHEAEVEASRAPIGIGICGGVDRNGLVFGPIALGWHGRVDFASFVSERVGAPAYVENDVNAGALAEHRWGAGRGADDFMYLAIGTGIGAGLVLGGRLYRGAHHLAGEIGHLSVDVDGVRCACGNRGCVEASCGGRAVAERLTEWLRGEGSATRTTLHGVMASRGELTSRDVFEHARQGDPFSEREVERMASHLAAAIVNVVNLLDLQRVVVGGGQSQNGLLLPAIERVLRTWRPYLHHGPGLIVPAGLGADTGVVGAIAVALEAHAPSPNARTTEPDAPRGGGVM